MPAIKVYTADLGFYEVAVAARSQKMALAHWGMKRDLFREGLAKETHDPLALAAAMQKVGLVFRRPIGSDGAFEEKGDAERTLLKSLGGNRKATKKKKAKRPQVRKKK